MAYLLECKRMCTSYRKICSISSYSNSVIPFFVFFCINYLFINMIICTNGLKLSFQQNYKHCNTTYTFKDKLLVPKSSISSQFGSFKFSNYKSNRQFKTNAKSEVTIHQVKLTSDELGQSLKVCFGFKIYSEFMSSVSLFCLWELFIK